MKPAEILQTALRQQISVTRTSPRLIRTPRHDLLGAWYLPMKKPMHPTYGPIRDTHINTGE